MHSPEPATFRFAQRTGHLRPSAIREILKTTESPQVISFAGGLPAPELFPVEAFAESCRIVLAEDGPAALQYGTTEGFRPLRQWVCEHLGNAIGLGCTPEQVLITSGSQQALDLLGKVLIDPGDIILAENPAYLGALQVFDSYQGRVVGIPADDEGFRTDELRRVLKSLPQRPRLLYLIPSFHNPTGGSTSLQRRKEILQIAGEHSLPIVEDDPYGRLRYDGTPLPAICTLPGGKDVVYLGTSSKIMAPGMRVAWMVIRNAELYEKIVPAKQAADLHTASFTQRIVWHYASQPGLLDAHIQQLRSTYAARRDAMLDALQRHFPEGCSWTHPEGGLFLWARLPEQIDTLGLLRKAAAHDVAFVPGVPFWVEHDVHNTLRLNFSNAAPERIEVGIERLAQVIGRELAGR